MEKLSKEFLELYKIGEYKKIIKKFESIQNKNNISRNIANIVAVTYVNLNQFLNAEKIFKNLIILDSNNPAIFNNLGIALQKQNKLEDAKNNFLKAIDLKSDYFQAFNNLGINFNLDGKINNAEECYKESIRINPNYVETLVNYGNLKNSKGEFEDAIKMFKKSIKLNPYFIDAYYSFANSFKISLKNKNFIFLKKLLSESKLTEEKKMLAYFAISKIYLDNKKNNFGFKYLEKANSLAKKKYVYRIENDKKIFFGIKKLFTNNDFYKLNNKNGQAPIFILGMPRSGTSLIEQILSSHSKIYGGGEIPFLNNSIASLNLDYEINENVFNKIRSSYLKMINKISKMPYITDKTPLNFKWIGFIIYSLPEAKIIHIKRNSISTCWSIYKNYFPSKEMAFGFNQHDVSNYYKLYNNLMSFWEKKFPKNIYNINYEDLINNQKIQTKRLINFLNIEWEPSLLNFHKTKRFVGTSSFSQVRKKIYKSSLNEWKKYKKFLKPMMLELKK